MSRRKEGPLADEDRANRMASVNASYERLEEIDLKWQMSSRQGRRIIARFIYDRCGLLTPGWAASAEIHKAAGFRVFASELLFQLEALCPLETRKMVDEWFVDRQTRLAKVEKTPLAPEEE